MPAGRYLRPEITNSERWNGVSMEAQSLFIRMVTVADDYGRGDGRPIVILNRTFTVWNTLHMEQAITLEKLVGLLKELAEKELIEIYDAPEERKKVFQILQWHDRIRQNRVLWPERSATSTILFGCSSPRPADKPPQPADSPPTSGGQPAAACQPPTPTPTPTPTPAPTPEAPPPHVSSLSAERQRAANIPPPHVSSAPANSIPSVPSEFIQGMSEAKKIISEKILGIGPNTPWSYQAESNLSRLCEDPGLPRYQLERIAWWRRLPKSDEVPELAARRDPITPTTLVEYWSDEFTRAEAYWRKVKGLTLNGAPPPKKKKKEWPPRAREFFRWKYGDDVTTPEFFCEMPDYALAEWENEHEEWERAVPREATA